MEHSNNSCCLCRSALQSTKGKGKQKKYSGRSCTREREILEKFVQTFKLSRSSLPTGGTLCYCCLSNLKKWDKMITEITVIQEQLKKHLTQSPSCSQVYRTKRTLSEAEREDGSTSPQNSLIPPEAEQTDTANKSIDMSVVINYPSGSRSFTITPSRKEPVKKLAKGSYPSFASSVVETYTDETLRAVGRTIQEEIAFICSDKANTILKGDKEHILNFSWANVFTDLRSHVPSLVKLLQFINPKAANNDALISVWISMMVKCRNDKLSLIQRVFAIFLYGNGVHKEVYKLLQPFMLCMSHKSTLNIIDELVQGYDTLPQTWRDKLTQDLPDNCEANLHDLDYDNNSGLGSAVMSVLGFIPQDESTGDATEDETDITDEIPSADVYSVSGDEEDGNDSEYGSCTDSECDFDAPPMSPISEGFNEGDMNSGNNDTNALPITPVTVCTEPTAVENSEPQQSERISSSWCGFKLVGDNIDKNVRPSFSRLDRKTKSLHCFHYYAVLDRLDFSSFSDITPNIPADPNKLLIDNSDVAQLNSDAVTLISRILVHHFEEFSSQAKHVQSHIKCKYDKEMSAISKVVPLGVIDKNENKVDEMCDIMDELHKLVPSKITQSNYTLPDGDVQSFLGETFHQLLLGGDQLTAARCRGSAAARCDSDTKKERLYGLMPVSEDWHAKYCLCKVIYQKLFGSSLIPEKGSLPQLKVLINFRAKVNPDKCMKGFEDYLLIALHAHVVAAAKQILSDTQFDSVKDLAREIVVRFVAFEPDVSIRVNDKVHLYALQVLNLALLWHGFNDSIREGDGDRIMTYYKFILNVFKAGRCFNYCKEVVILLTQFHCLLSERQAAQLKWSRCINTKGFHGCNVPCDLHLEHLNRRLKGMIRGLHSNVTPKALGRAAQSVGIVHQVCDNLSTETNLLKESGRHVRASFNKECTQMVKQLEEQKVFMDMGRKPTVYKHIKSILQQYTKQEIKDWIIQKYGTYRM